MWQINNLYAPDLLLRPHVQKNGQWTLLPTVSLRKVIAAADELKPHRIEIETRGATIRTRIDGTLVDERSDATFAAGTVGFRADSKEQATVDSVTVTDATGKSLLSETFDADSKAFPKAKLEKGQLAVCGATLLHRPPLPKECPRLRKTFTLDKPVRRATASVCGLGFYELYLNGKKASDRVLAPANTPYSQRLLFDTVDVTALVRPGANAVGLWLAPGY
jgi:alpha-L-rhamnosidase